MRPFFLFALAAIFLISACVNADNVTKAGISFTEKSTEDILVRAELSQNKLKSNLNTSIRFTITNKQPFDLKNLRVDAYDLCDFTCDKTAVWEEQIIRINRTKDFILNCRAPVVEQQRSCEIKFRTVYEGTHTQTHDVVVVSESEYARSPQVSALSTSSASPMKIFASWSEPQQPFVEKDKVFLYLDYEYSGDGIIEKLRGASGSTAGDISFTAPPNLLINLDNCIDFAKSTGERNYTLKKDIFFTGSKAKRSTCTFDTKASQPIDSGKLFINAKFNYQLDGSVPVTIAPRKNI